MIGALVFSVLLGACSSHDSVVSSTHGTHVSTLLHNIAGVHQLFVESPLRSVTTTSVLSEPRYLLTYNYPPVSASSHQFRLPRDPVHTTIDPAGTIRIAVDSHRELVVSRVSPSDSGKPSMSAKIEESGVVTMQGGQPCAFSFATKTGTEDLLIAYDSQKVGYRFNLPQQWSLQSLDRLTGIVHVLDEHSLPRLRIRTGNSWDSTGQQIQPEMQIVGNSILWTVPSGVHFPAAIDPSFEDTGSLIYPRAFHTATLLPSGVVMIAGGQDAQGAPSDRVEFYDPVTGTSRIGNPLELARYNHSAILIPNSQSVVILGGQPDGDGQSLPAEVYDTGAEITSIITSSGLARRGSSLTGLEKGTILVAGGQKSTGESIFSLEWLAPIEIFTAHKMEYYHVDHSATLIPNEQVLLAAGAGEQNEATANVEVYDAVSGKFSARTPLSQPRVHHTATYLPQYDNVLIVGGEDDTGGSTNSAELYNVTTDTTVAVLTSQFAHSSHTATLLPSGKVLLVGASPDETNSPCAEIFDPESSSFEAVSSYAQTVRGHTATLLPFGNVLFAGGLDSTGQVSSAVTIFDDEKPAVVMLGSSDSGKREYTTTLLPSGKVLLAGGIVGSNFHTAATEIYDPETDTFVSSASLTHPRAGHSATLLNNGLVLIAGGRGESSSVEASGELFDPVSESVQALPAAFDMGRQHSATLLPSAQVLFVGGKDSQGESAQAAIYDVEHNSLRSVGSLNHGRYGHGATLLPTGKVLIAGGTSGDGVELGVEIFDPRTEEFELASIYGDWVAAATILNQQALLASNGTLDRVVGEGLSVTTSLGVNSPQALIPLVNGDVVVAGDNSAIVFPTTSQFFPFVAPALSSAVRLASGAFLGFGSTNVLFDPRSPTFALPKITECPESLSPGKELLLYGKRFTTLTPKNGSAQRAYTNSVPLVAFVRATSNESPVFGTTLEWSDTSIRWTPPRGVYHGPGFIHVFANGMWSDGIYSVMMGKDLAVGCSLDGECSSNHCVDGVCCDSECSSGCQMCNRLTGRCTDILLGGEPRFGCSWEGSFCGPIGTCDGQGSCATPEGEPCWIQASNEFGICEKGECVSSPVAVCITEDTLQDEKGAQIDCTPYVCRTDDCLTACESQSDCAAKYRCTEAGRCELQVPASEPSDNGACSVCVVRGNSESDLAVWLWSIGLLIAMRKQRTGKSYTSDKRLN